MIVAICCTRNWYRYLETELYALNKYNKTEKVYLFIEDDNIEFLKDDNIEFINVNKQKEYVTQNSPNYNTKYSKMSYVRCYFSKLIKDSKVLYIDADAIVVDNIKNLWNTNVEDYAMAGVKEAGEWGKHLGIEGMDNKYINSGVLLMNLDYIRRHKLDNKMIELLNTKFYRLPDQDVINVVCKDKIKYVSNIYNSTETTGIVDNAKIVHYIRQNKGWIQGSLRSEIWYKHYDEMIKERRETSMVKVEVIENFHLARFNEISNIVRRTREEANKLFVGDIFTCTEEMAKYLTGANAHNRAFVKVIEIIPVPTETPNAKEVKIELKEEKATKKTATKKTTSSRKTIAKKKKI